MLSEVAEFVVQGITVEGDVFQPPDWAERLCVTLPGAGGGKACSGFVRPMMIGGVNCLVVRTALQKDNARAFELIKRFIAENRLVVRSGRGSRDAESTGPRPVIGKERRDPSRNNW